MDFVDNICIWHQNDIVSISDKNTVKYTAHVDDLVQDSSISIANMMTSSNGYIFRVTGHLCGEFTGPRWIPHTKASDAELWCLLWSAPEYTVE